MKSEIESWFGNNSVHNMRTKQKRMQNIMLETTQTEIQKQTFCISDIESHILTMASVNKLDKSLQK